MNYSTQGSTFFPAYLSQPYGDLTRRAFFKDGRFRETTFIVEAFRRTACFRKGQAHCGHCHQPHAADSSTNPTSLKFRDQPDRMCLQCHAKFAANASAHTHHATSSDTSRCVACHMPRITNSVLFRARTHQIDDIPNAEMTARFGPEESPNACLLCRLGKTCNCGLHTQHRCTPQLCASTKRKECVMAEVAIEQRQRRIRSFPRQLGITDSQRSS